MDGYDDIDDLINDLEDDVLRITENEIREELIDIIHKKSKNIYALYDNNRPNRYDRGVKGSFGGDIDVIEVKSKKNRNSISITGLNNAKGEGFDKNEYLDYYIHEAIYQFASGDVPKRPVMDWVLDYLEKSDVIEKIIDYELSKLGYEIE